MDNGRYTWLSIAFKELHEAFRMNSWTCTEAEILYEIHLDIGMHDEAESFMLAHAWSDSDDEGDLHHYISNDADHRLDRWERVE